MSNVPPVIHARRASVNVRSRVSEVATNAAYLLVKAPDKPVYADSLVYASLSSTGHDNSLCFAEVRVHQQEKSPKCKDARH